MTKCSLPVLPEVFSDNATKGKHSIVDKRKHYIINYVIVINHVRESVDSLCRDGADAQYMQYLSKCCITSPQIW